MRWLFLALLALIGCKADMTEQELIAAKADQTTRQLIAGLNAKNADVLGTLIVVTNTEGGKPRALTKEEKDKLVYPSGPYEQIGAGKPGTMLVRDGRGQKRAVRLIVLDEKLKVLASRESFAAYTARETGTNVPGGAGANVVSFLLPAD